MPILLPILLKSFYQIQVSEMICFTLVSGVNHCLACSWFPLGLHVVKQQLFVSGFSPKVGYLLAVDTSLSCHGLLFVKIKKDRCTDIALMGIH